jgi:hypothetical protein
MGATSVTGVSGHGAAEGCKGPGNRRNQFVPLRSPHVAGVLMGGDAALATTTVKVPGLSGEGFAILVTAENGMAAPVVAARTLDVDGNLVTFDVTITGDPTQVEGVFVSWAVVNIGQ